MLLLRTIRPLQAWLKQQKHSWESLCNQCGICCYEKKIIRGRTVVDYAAPCPYLNSLDMSCTVYARRFKACRQCRPMTLWHALFAGYLPVSCGYVKRYRFYQNWFRKSHSA